MDSSKSLLEIQVDAGKEAAALLGAASTVPACLGRDLPHTLKCTQELVGSTRNYQTTRRGFPLLVLCR